MEIDKKDEVQQGDVNLSFGAEAAPEEKDKKETETPASPSDEKKPDGSSPSHQGEEGKDKEGEEGADDKDKDKKPNTDDVNLDKLPFHKHPRWKALNEENQQLRDTVEQQNERLKKLEEKPDKPNESEEKIPEWFSKVYGDDPEEWAKYKGLTTEMRKQIKEEIINDFKKAETSEKETLTKWEKWIDNSLQKLEDEGKEFDRNELLKVLDEYRPTDSNGNLDFNRAYEILQLKKQQENDEQKKKSDAKKKIASQTIDNGKPINNSKETFKTPADLRGKSFHDFN